MIDQGKKCFLKFNSKLLLAAVTCLLLAAGTAFSNGVASSKTTSQTLSTPTLRLEQCSNGTNGDQQCTGANWTTACCGSLNSHWREGDSIPFRSVFTGLTPGQVYHVTITYGSMINGKHAIDYLTSYN